MWRIALKLGLGLALAIGLAADPAPPAGPAKPSPFLAPTPPAYPLQLAGVSSAAGKVLVCIYDLRVKHTAWIAVGEGIGPLVVLAYNAPDQTVTLSLNGVRHTLALQGSTVLPGTSPTAEGPADLKRRQDEARMLVSDLLDIGMEQRRAYDAARKAPTKAPIPGSGP